MGRWCGLICGGSSTGTKQTTSSKWCSSRRGGPATGSIRAGRSRHGCSGSHESEPLITCVDAAMTSCPSNRCGTWSGSTGMSSWSGWPGVHRCKARLGLLPPEQRTAIGLSYFQDMTQVEIAAHLGLPIGTVKARMARGMRRLATLIEQGAERDR